MSINKAIYPIINEPLNSLVFTLKDQEQPPFFRQVPCEVVALIFTPLPMQEIVGAKLISKYFYILLNKDDSIWSRLFASHFPGRSIAKECSKLECKNQRSYKLESIFNRNCLAGKYTCFEENGGGRIDPFLGILKQDSNYFITRGDKINLSPLLMQRRSEISLLNAQENKIFIALKNGGIEIWDDSYTNCQSKFNLKNSLGVVSLAMQGDYLFVACVDARVHILKIPKIEDAEMSITEEMVSKGDQLAEKVCSSFAVSGNHLFMGYKDGSIDVSYWEPGSTELKLIDTCPETYFEVTLLAAHGPHQFVSCDNNLGGLGPCVWTLVGQKFQKTFFWHWADTLLINEMKQEMSIAIRNYELVAHLRDGTLRTWNCLSNTKEIFAQIAEHFISTTPIRSTAPISWRANDMLALMPKSDTNAIYRELALLIKHRSPEFYSFKSVFHGDSVEENYTCTNAERAQAIENFLAKPS